MRISNEELQRIAYSNPSSVAVESSGSSRVSEVNVVASLESQDMKMITEALALVPDIREQVVASLKERIESGSYQVSGEQIAEMMVRRSLADRVR